MIGLSDNWYRGKENWLFLGNAHDKTVAKTKLRFTPPPVEVRRTRELFEQLSKTSSQYGILTVLILGPDKSSIYPEYLPDNVIPSSQKYINFFLESLGNIANLKILDPTNALLAGKGTSEILYFKEDTHWNPRGTFVAYTRLANLLDLPVPQVEFQQAAPHFGDLLTMSGLPSLTKEYKLDIIWKTQPAITETVIPNEPEMTWGSPVIVINQKSLTNK